MPISPDTMALWDQYRDPRAPIAAPAAGDPFAAARARLAKPAPAAAPIPAPTAPTVGFGSGVDGFLTRSQSPLDAPRVLSGAEARDPAMEKEIAEARRARSSDAGQAAAPTGAVINATPDQGPGGVPGGGPNMAQMPSYGGGAAGHVVPGHLVPTTSPQVADKFRTALGLEGAANEGLGAAEANAATKGADAIDREREKLGKYAEDLDAKEGTRRKALGEYAAIAKGDQLAASTGTIDYNRLAHNTGMGTKLAAAALSAMATFARGGNPTDFWQQWADRDIAEQKDQLANKRQNAEASANLVHRMRGVFGDERAADDASLAIRYRQAALAMQAEAQRTQSPVLLAKAKVGSAELLEKAAKIEEGLGKWVPPTTVGAAADKEAKIRELAKELLKDGRAGSPEDALGLATRTLAGGNMNLGAEARFKEGSADKKAEGTQHASEVFNKEMDDIKASGLFDKLGLGTAAAAHLGQRLAPGASATDQDLKQVNTQILQAIGKVAKDADGKPNVAMLQRLEERFAINLGDTKAMALQKLEGARATVNALAQQQGANVAPSADRFVQ